MPESEPNEQSAGKNPSPDENRGLPLVKGELHSVNFSAWQLAWELGYTIAVPIVILALVGRFADRHFDSSPWLLVAGIVLSVFLSSALVYKKVKKIL